MSAFQSKYHIGIDSKGFILDRGERAVYAYQKKRAPQWVNRTGSGDSTYRDSTFWQYWAQINWRNGAKQEKFGDGGKFWKSSGIDTTQIEQASIAKSLVSLGQVESGAKVLSMAAWRGSQNWWNANYGYRQQLTITAGSNQITANYPIKVTVDTSVLETANKVRSDRKDWRIIYWNGTSWVDLYRDYVSTSLTVFATQKTIAANSSDTNYYLYYGYSGESSSQQPTDDASWLSVYGMYGTTLDANTIGLWMFNNGSGNTITDQDSSHDLTGSNMGWTNTNGYFGRGGVFTLGNDYATYNDTGGDFNLGSMTVEAFIKTGNLGSGGVLVSRYYGTTTHWNLFMNGSGKISFSVQGTLSSSGTYTATSTSPLAANTIYHVAGTYDGSTAIKIYVNGIEAGAGSNTEGGIYSSPTGALYLGANSSINDNWLGQLSMVRISNTARTSFPYGQVGSITATSGSEITTQPPSSNFTLFVGTDTGNIYSWDGITTWTLSKECNLLEDTGTTTDSTYRVGDTSGTEYKVAQSIQFTKGINLKSISLYLKATATAPAGDITVRLEADDTNKPSGNLVNASSTGTISNFTETTNSYKTCTFDTAITLSASTKYWIVVSCAAQSNNVGWDLAVNTSGAYSSGDVSSYNGSSWTLHSGTDACFKLYSTNTSVNVLFVSAIGGTQYLLAGLGTQTSEINGDARLIKYDGSSWSLDKQFITSTESQVISMAEYAEKLYVGVGPQGRIYETDDLSTWTLSKDIDFPQKPGYPYTIKEYNSQLIASGGSPEFLSDKYYNGFSFVNNGTIWQSLYPFDHTVVKSQEFYDSFLFLGTYHGQIYTYNTSYLDPLFSFKDDYGWNVVIQSMKYFDDKLYIGLRAQDGTTETNTGLWVFDRHGMTQISSINNNAGIYSLEQVNNLLIVGTSDGYVYKLDPTTYQTSGWIQTSYFDANLPSVPKLWNSLQINHDPLLAGHSIAAAYRYKESDSWITLTPSATQAVGDTSTKWEFPTGISSNKISLMITLSTSDSTSSPIMREFIFQYCLFPVVKWQWNLRIKTKSPLKLADGTTDARSAETMRTDLETLLSDTALHTFTDIDGNTHTVLFYDLDETSWVINQTDTSGSTVPCTLIEV